MNVGDEDLKRVTLVPGGINIRQKSMTAFTFKDIKLVYANEKKRGIQMKLRIKRKITSEMLTTYFPSFLLLMITYATTFFKPSFFEAALSVNLTTMLVMTTIFMSKMESLPTADIRMIDIWLIFCQMVPFSEVVLLTAMEYFRDQGQQENETTENPEVNKQKKAWANVPKKCSKITLLSMLAMIGKF